MQECTFPLNDIYQVVMDKRNIYECIAAKTHQTDGETAIHIITGELETYLNRLQSYWDDPVNHKTGDPTLTTAQGVNIFLEVMQSGLSFSQVANHVYVSRLKGTGTAVGYKTTADGDVYTAQKAGAIDHLSEPVLVQNGEQFKIINTADGRHVAVHEAMFDGRPVFNFESFLVGYIYIIYPNGNRELSWISHNRLNESRQKSTKPNNYNDESFIQTKVIRHALRKVRKTPFMQQLRSNDEEIIQNNMEWADPSPQDMRLETPTGHSAENVVQSPTHVGSEPF